MIKIFHFFYDDSKFPCPKNNSFMQSIDYQHPFEYCFKKAILFQDVRFFQESEYLSLYACRRMGKKASKY